MTLHAALPRSFASLVVSVLLTVPAPAAASDDWPQWGGPERNFRIDGQLAATWPPEGPRIVWRRLVGDGYSAVAAAG
ncbi:MAG TPA: hypothetical protein VMS86_06395, partial [Thermoanaerobaculia bacterium]|nr:hypothetical protein [Thermoanaerobaculia bacterium]